MSRALTVQLEQVHPASALVVLLVQTLPNRAPVEERADDTLAEALPLYPVHGPPLLARLPPARSAAIVARMEPVPHDARGFWTYVARTRRAITAALAGFRTPCRPSVAVRLTELARALPAGARAGLETIAAGDGPNAKIVAAALAPR